jgi:hypothetical protein
VKEEISELVDRKSSPSACPLQNAANESRTKRYDDELVERDGMSLLKEMYLAWRGGRIVVRKMDGSAVRQPTIIHQLSRW